MHDSSLTEFEFYARHSALKRPEYHFEIEELRRGEDQMLLAHLGVSKFSPTIFQRMLADFQIFRSCVSAPLFAFGATDDRKWERFVRSFGFRPLSHVLCNDGLTRRLFIHLKDFSPDGFEPTAAADLGQERDRHEQSARSADAVPDAGLPDCKQRA